MTKTKKIQIRTSSLPIKRTKKHICISPGKLVYLKKVTMSLNIKVFSASPEHKTWGHVMRIFIVKVVLPPSSLVLTNKCPWNNGIKVVESFLQCMYSADQVGFVWCANFQHIFTQQPRRSPSLLELIFCNSLKENMWCANFQPIFTRPAFDRLGGSPGRKCWMRKLSACFHPTTASFTF